MKQVVGVLLLASTIGLAIAATSSAGTNHAGTSCAALVAAMKAAEADITKAAHNPATPSATMLGLDNKLIALAAQAKGCTGSNSSALPTATLGKLYPATSFCRAPLHLTPTRKQCLDAGGKLITFKNEGDLLPLGMHFDPFTGTVSGTPRTGQSTRSVRVHLCWGELLQNYPHCDDATLIISSK